MIRIHKDLFYNTFNKNIDLYLEFIEIIKSEYKETIYNLSKSTTILDIRNNVHKLISIISNIKSSITNELLYLCKLLLQNEKIMNIDYYYPMVKPIVEYNSYIIGL